MQVTRDPNIAQLVLIIHLWCQIFTRHEFAEFCEFCELREYNQRVIEIEHGTFTPPSSQHLEPWVTSVQNITQNISRENEQKDGGKYEDVMRYIRGRGNIVVSQGFKVFEQNIDVGGGL